MAVRQCAEQLAELKAPTKNMQLRSVSMLSTRPTIVTARDQGCHYASNHVPVLPLPVIERTTVF